MAGNKIYIGTSGWNYNHWKGRFYPEKLSQKKWLEYYQNFFSTVEVNMTFYRFPKREIFSQWKKDLKKNFLFSLKANRIITHIKKLKDVENLVKNFIDISSELEAHLGPILFQLPPSWNLNIQRFKEFLVSLKHSKASSNLKFVIELRDERWKNKEIYEILRNENICLCFSDHPECAVDGPVTSDIVYIRKHGPGSLYSSCYSLKEIYELSEEIKKFVKDGKIVYVYFNNDANAWAIKNVLELKNNLKEFFSNR
ncbi:MAG: DUF72 domain-containing protein [Acidobacteriota bacterium]